LRLEEKEPARPENVLMRPRLVARDRRGQVWVSDEAVPCVKLFNRQGTCILTLGGRGKGPTEFQHVTAMCVTPSNDLLVIDYLNAKIALFSESGTLLRTHPWPTAAIQWPRKVECTPDGGFVVLAKPEGKDLVLHTFTNDWRYVTSFAPLPAVNKAQREFESCFAGSNPGEVAVTSEGVVYYVPALYGGAVFAYQGGAAVMTLRGGKWGARAYECEFSPGFRPGPPPAKYQIVVAIGGKGMYYARRNVIPGGLVVLEDGTLANLLTVYKGADYEIGAELFPPRAAEGVYQRLAGKELPEGEWQASNGRWYCIEVLAEPPRVREFVLEPAE
jgi:hypothetical protein